MTLEERLRLLGIGSNTTPMGKVQNSIGNATTRLNAAGYAPPDTATSDPWWLKALHIIDTPRNAIATGIANATDGGDFSTGFGEGWRGEKRTYGSDFLKGVDNNILRTVAGFGVDVALDPLTYMTMGLGSFAKGAATRSGVALGESAAKMQARDMLLDQVGRAMGTAAKTHGVESAMYTGANKADDLINGLHALSGSDGAIDTFRQALGRENPFAQRIGEYLDKIPKTHDDITGLSHFDKGSLAESVNHFVSTTGEEYGQKVANQFNRTVGVGVHVPFTKIGAEIPGSGEAMRRAGAAVGNAFSRVPVVGKVGDVVADGTSKIFNKYALPRTSKNIEKYLRLKDIARSGSIDFANDEELKYLSKMFNTREMKQYVPLAQEIETMFRTAGEIPTTEFVQNLPESPFKDIVMSHAKLNGNPLFNVNIGEHTAGVSKGIYGIVDGRELDDMVTKGLTGQSRTRVSGTANYDKMPQLDVATEAAHIDLTNQQFTQSHVDRHIFEKVDAETGGTAIAVREQGFNMNGVFTDGVLHVEDVSTDKALRRRLNNVVKHMNQKGEMVDNILINTDLNGVKKLRNAYGDEAVMVGDLATDGKYSVSVDMGKTTRLTQDVGNMGKGSRWQYTTRYFSNNLDDAADHARVLAEKGSDEVYIVQLDNLSSHASTTMDKVAEKSASNPAYRAQSTIIKPENTLNVYRINPKGTDINTLLEDVTPDMAESLKESSNGTRIFKQQPSEVSLIYTKKYMRFKDGNTFVPRMKSDGTASKFGEYEVWRDGKKIDTINIVKDAEKVDTAAVKGADDAEKAMNYAREDAGMPTPPVHKSFEATYANDLKKLDEIDMAIERYKVPPATQSKPSADMVSSVNAAKDKVAKLEAELTKIPKTTKREVTATQEQIDSYWGKQTGGMNNGSLSGGEIDTMLGLPIKYPKSGKGIVESTNEAYTTAERALESARKEYAKAKDSLDSFVPTTGAVDTSALDAMKESRSKLEASINRLRSEHSAGIDKANADHAASVETYRANKAAESAKTAPETAPQDAVDDLQRYGFKDLEDFNSSVGSKQDYTNFAEVYNEVTKIDPNKMDAATKILEKPELMYSNELTTHEQAMRTVGVVLMDNLRQAGMKERNIALMGDLMDDYIPHIVSWEKQNKADRMWQGGMSGRNMITQNLNSMPREYKTTIEEANRMIAAKGGGENFFETNLAKAYLSRMIRHNKVVYDNQFITRLLDNVGTEVSSFTPENIKAAYESLKATGDAAKYVMVVPKQSISIFGLNKAGSSTLNSMIEFMDNGLQLSKGAEKMSGMDTKIREAHDTLKSIQAEISRVVADNPDAGKAVEGMLGLEGQDLKTVMSGLGSLDNINESDYAIIKQMADAVSKIPKTVTKFRDTQGLRSTLERLASPLEGSLAEVDEHALSLLGANVTNLKAYLIPDEVYKFVNKTAKGQFDEGMNILTNMVDSFNKFWKVTVTSMIPSFHIRNLFGGMQQNAFEFGVKCLSPKFMKASVGIAAGRDGAVKLGGKEYAYSEVRRLMSETRVNTPFFKTEANDLSGMYRHEFEKSVKRRALSKALPWNVGRDVGNFTEQQLRATNFMAWMDEGVDASAAAERTKAVMFDYTELSDAERRVFKRVMPFYTFFRKNFAYQLENVMNRPGQYAMIQHYINNSAEANGYDTSNAPEWLAKSLALPLGKDGQGMDKYANLSLPASDAFGRSFKDILTGLNPLAVAPVELYANQNFLTGAPIERYPGQTTNVGGIEIRNGVLHALQKVGVVRNAVSGMSSSDDPAGMFTSDKSPLSPASAFGIVKKYDETKGELSTAYEQDRALANQIQKLKDQGVDVPTVADTNKVGGVTVRGLAKAQRYTKYR